MNLSLRQIRAFVLIAELRSITRAAERLHISQAGLSSLLRDVESQLGCRLFDRTTRSVALTGHGHAFLPVAMRVLGDLERAAADLARVSEQEARRIVIGATPLIASSVLPRACARFARDWPATEVEIEDLDRGRIRERVRDGALDAGYGVFIEPATELRRTPLQRTALMLVRPGEGPASVRGAPVRWRGLGEPSLVALPPDNPIQRRVELCLAEAGVQVRSRRPFHHLHTLLAMVEAGAGWAILPAFVAAACERYRVDLAPLVRPQVSVEFYEISRKARPRSAAVAAFSACLIAELEAESVTSSR